MEEDEKCHKDNGEHEGEREKIFGSMSQSFGEQREAPIESTETKKLQRAEKTAEGLKKSKHIPA